MKQQYEHSSSVVRGTKNFMSQVPPLNQFIQCFIDKCFRLKCNLYVWLWNQFLLQVQVRRSIIIIPKT